MRELNMNEVNTVSGGLESCAGMGTVAGATITADGAVAGIVAGAIVGGPVGAVVGGVIAVLGGLIGAVVGVEITEACEAAAKT